jgi:hypothetical protein
MISYEMKKLSPVRERNQLNASLRPSVRTQIEKLAEEFEVKPSTIAGEIIELAYHVWARNKRLYEEWMKKQLEDSIVPPEAAYPDLTKLPNGGEDKSGTNDA